LSLRVLRIADRLLSLRLCLVGFALAGRQQDLLPLRLAGFHTRGGHLLLRALLRDACHLRGEVRIVSSTFVLRALLFCRAFGVDQQLTRPVEFGGRVLRDIGIGLGGADSAARLIEHAAGFRGSLATHHA
jgi:hypothetical protein